MGRKQVEMGMNREWRGITQHGRVGSGFILYLGKVKKGLLPGMGARNR